MFFRALKLFDRYYPIKKTALLVVASTILPFLDGFGFLTILPIVDPNTLGENAPRSIHWLKQFIFLPLGIPENLFATVALALFAFYGKACIGYLLERERLRGGKIITNAYIDENLKLLENLELKAFASQSGGVTASHITNHSQRLLIAFQSIVSVISFGLTSVIYLALATTIQPRATGIAILAGIFVLFLLRAISRATLALSKQSAEAHTVVFERVLQALQNLRYLIATHRSPNVRLGVMRSAIRSQDLYEKLSNLRSLSGQIMDPIAITIALGLVVIENKWFGTPIGALALTIVLIQRSTKQLLSFQQVWQTFLSIQGSLEVLEEHRQQLVSNQRIHTGTNSYQFKRSIRFENVTFSYSKKPVLNGVTFEIPYRSTVALVGTSGAGKSTCIDLLTGLAQPDTGRVLYDDIDLSDLRLNELREAIGYVTQEPYVIGDSLRANFVYFDSKLTDENIWTALKRARAARFVEAFDCGLDEPMRDRGARLSGGQRQRIAIARELAREPELLILDEATSALDLSTERELTDELKALKGQMTLVVVSHRITSLSWVDQILVFDQGKIVESGTFADLSSRKNSFFSKMLAQSEHVQEGSL